MSWQNSRAGAPKPAAVAMNACAFCKKGKRKCDRARPSCSNCVRLYRDCVYTEDFVQTHFDDVAAPTTRAPFELSGLQVADSLAGGVDPFSHATLQQSTVDVAMRILGSVENILNISAEFFTGTHQRIPALSRFRFQDNLQSLMAQPRANFAALCLSILLVQQTPSPSGTTASVQSPLYFAVKSLISSLEGSNNLSLDLVHCRILVTFYEMGHGLHGAAFVSVAACARTARALGLHRKKWRNLHTESKRLDLEEEKRVWWAIVTMERFIGLCNGDALFITNDPERTDPLPIDDLLWSEGLDPTYLEDAIASPPSLETPFNVTVGQMARESQISYLAGRVVRHVFDPTPDPEFNAEEAAQLERTLKAYLPLLADEELRIGKYCGAFGVCNSALFTLYEFLLSRPDVDAEARDRILLSIEETSIRAFIFAEASYSDRAVNYPYEILSPYLPYSLCQAGIVQYRLWQHSGDPTFKQRLDTLKCILREFTHRWMVAFQYLEILDKLHESWPPITFPFQGSFIGTGGSRI